MMMGNFKRKQVVKTGAFTLIELLVVISVIALLLAVIMPGLQKAKEQAKAVVCMSNMKQFGTAWAMYAQSNHDKNPTCPTKISDYSEGKVWFYQLAPYFSDTSFNATSGNTKDGVMKVMACPSAKPWDNQWDDSLGFGGAKVAWRFEITENGGLAMPDNYRTTKTYVTGGYTVNGWVLETDTNNWASEDVKKLYQRFSRAPGTAPLLSDGGWVDARPKTGDRVATDYLKDLEGTGQGPAKNRMGGSYNALARLMLKRHKRNLNMLFVDSHVEKVPLEEVWALPWHKGFVRTDRLLLDQIR